MKNYINICLVALAMSFPNCVDAQFPREASETEAETANNLEGILTELRTTRPLCLTASDGRPRRVITLYDGVSLLGSPHVAPSRVAISAAFELWFVYSEVTPEGWLQLGQHSNCEPSDRVWGKFDAFVELGADSRMLMWFPADDNNSAPLPLQLLAQPSHAKEPLPAGELLVKSDRLESRCFPILATAEGGWYEVLGLPNQVNQPAIRGWINVNESNLGTLREMLYVRRLEMASVMARLMGLASDVARGQNPDKVREFISTRDTFVEGQMRSEESVTARQEFYRQNNRRHRELLYGLTEGWAEQNINPRTKGWYQNGPFCWIPMEQIP